MRYRFHIPDPIYFDENCRVTIQQLGGTSKKRALEIEELGHNIIVTASHPNEGPTYFLEEKNKNLDWHSDEYPENAMVTFYREDDYCATAYFYLTTPENNLPEIQNLKVRQAKISTKKGKFGNEGLID